MKETKLTHTQRRSGVYYFRRKIPLELIAHYGKAEIAFSLKTKERKEAEPLARKWGVFYDDEFAEARKSLSPPAAIQQQQKIMKLNLKNIVLRWVKLSKY